VDYTIIFLFRFSHLLSQCIADRERAQKVVEFVKIGILFSFFVSWTIVGTVWFLKARECFDQANQFYTLIFWLSVCYIWIALYLCLLVLQYVFQSDPQFNHIGVLGDGRRRLLPQILLARLTERTSCGLPDNQIAAIPMSGTPPEAVGEPCAICIEQFQKDDICKHLPSCIHFFHAQCVDSWLRRKSDCPVCRTPVSVPPNTVTQPIGMNIV